MTNSSDRFARVSGLSRGYSPEQVDEFLANVEDGLRGTGDAAKIRAADVRRAGFDLVRGGYAVQAVDRYLDQVEQWALDLELGNEAASAEGLVAEAEALATRLGGGAGKRFPRTAFVRRGYAVREVDDFIDRLVPLLRDQLGRTGSGLDADAVRLAVFHGRHGGYDEVAVDEALDRVVDLLLRRESLLRDVPQANPH